MAADERKRRPAPQDSALALPPYAYVPGAGRPHPTRDPGGHSYGCAEGFGNALVRGVRLFDHGYYWEAHEAWEQPFRAAAPESTRRDFYKALIALAAAGLKVRQGLKPQALRFAQRATRTFERLRSVHGLRYEGMDVSALCEVADRVASETRRVTSDAEPAVQVVFSVRLARCWPVE